MNNMDQRNALKIKGSIDFSKLKWKKFSKKNKKEFGRKIRLQSKSFNLKFIDSIDVENYKNFVESIYKISYDLNNYKLSRKLFNDYKIMDLYFDNIEIIGKEYLDYLYLRVIRTLFDIRDSKMQAHRDIIDICKLGYEKTGHIECYYYLAYIINHMCWCCYKPTNAWKIALKYYELCLSNGYENYEIYRDLIDIYCNYMFHKDTIELEIDNDTEKKNEYFNLLQKYWSKINEQHYEENFGLTHYLLFDDYFHILIVMKKKSLLDTILFNENITKINKIPNSYLTDCLCYYYDSHFDDFTNIIIRFKKEMTPIDYLDLKIKLYIKQNKQTELITSIEELLKLDIQSKEHSNQIASLINSFFDYYYENIFMMSSELCVKLIDFYYLKLQNSYYYRKWKIIFIIFFNVCLCETYDDYLNNKINMLYDNNESTNILTVDFGRSETYDAKKIIDGIENISNYLINKKNKDLITTFINFLSKVHLFCCYDFENKYTNPFKLVKSKTKFKQISEPILETTLKTSSETDTKKNNTWCFVKGDDPDYDQVYPTYSDYYNALYGNNDQINQKIKSTNEYIQEKINLVKEKIESFMDS
jgi:hypothetical protein